MVELHIPLNEVVSDFEQEVDLLALSEEEAINKLVEAYTFLGQPLVISLDNGVAVIVAQVGKPQQAREAARTCERANELAQRGNYERAILLYKQALEILPGDADARRNLAMAYLESKQIVKARQHLLEALRLDPKNAWSNLLAGNILARYDHNPDAASKWYRRAYETDPHDPILLTNIGALLKEQGRTDEAADYFASAIAANPRYPNAHYALALIRLEAQQPAAAAAQLDALFASAGPQDSRSNSLMAEVRKLYAQAYQQLAEEQQEALMQAVETRRAEVAEITHRRIDLVEDDSLEVVSAVSQSAWRYQRDDHLIRFRRKDPAALPHVLFHEFQHLEMIDAARKAGRNRYFATSAAAREQGIRLIQEDVQKLQSLGVAESAIERTVLAWINGLTTQLFNIPLDMTIEHNLYQQYPALRPAQFVSLRSQQLENVAALTDPSVKRLTPHRIYRPSVVMNCAFALFTDFLYEGRTDYATPYRSTNAFAAGERLFKLWKDSLGVFEAGDEYILVDEFARELHLPEWYHWVTDTELALADPDRPEGSTNLGLLRQKDSASVWYLLAALEYFDGMPLEEVRAITLEIALLGVNGLDYASSDEKYAVRSLSSDKKFTGLQLMCYMYVGFKSIDPAQNAGIDLDEPYQQAQRLFQSRHPREDN